MAFYFLKQVIRYERADMAKHASMNHTRLDRISLYLRKSESAYKCYLNPLFSHEDLTDHSVASLAVISIILSTAVLMVVCVVDDELAPRMKPNSAGEPSKFSYLYGYPFFSAALSFLPVQICACLQSFLYFSSGKAEVCAWLRGQM
ncbi:hypothetical protein OESDEN_01055 [Oesophagostomum dentatum]|uniref:Uncharacterized protein n=1 Tax=Oesophagostomum dentatum TaxID=61180 RepID=A0A0B1TNX2_OESDE|nr:hypothetical protein OESDEN_01055 [Oesophagostomum dentatum]